jgi:RNA polymerase sigma factor (sigma-70 family)
MDRALTKEQSDFATAHHGMVERFLRKHGYSEDEFYDTVIFGYLGAVRDFFEKEGLAEKYAFSTIAYRQMRFRAIDLIRAQNRLKRKAVTLTFDEDIYGDPRDIAGSDPERALNELDAASALRAALTPGQAKIIDLKTHGYCNREIAKLLSVTPRRIGSEIGAARARVRAEKNIAA